MRLNYIFLGVLLLVICMPITLGMFAYQYLIDKIAYLTRPAAKATSFALFA